MNLTEANSRGPEAEPLWYELYSAKTEYGLADLSPASMDNLLRRMLTDDDLFNVYFRHRNTPTCAQSIEFTTRFVDAVPGTL